MFNAPVNDLQQRIYHKKRQGQKTHQPKFSFVPFVPFVVNNALSDFLT